MQFLSKLLLVQKTINYKFDFQILTQAQKTLKTSKTEVKMLGIYGLYKFLYIGMSHQYLLYGPLLFLGTKLWKMSCMDAISEIVLYILAQSSPRAWLNLHTLQASHFIIQKLLIGQNFLCILSIQVNTGLQILQKVYNLYIVKKGSKKVRNKT